jgi:hypothetical protein
MTGPMLRRLLAVLLAVPLLLVLSPSAALACGVSYEGGDPNSGCSGAIPVGGAVVVGGAAVLATLALSALSFLRGTMSAADFGTLLAAIAATAPPAPGPPALPPGRASQSLAQLRATRDPAQRWQNAENWMREMTGAQGEPHYPVAPNDDPDFPVTTPGGRFVDSPVPLPGGGTLAIEVKMYRGYRTVTLSSGQKLTQQVEVPLTDKIREQINKDVAIRADDASYDPRWAFPDAGPSTELREHLNRAGIIFLEYD